ncbi:vWA domain-containing protein [Candidatus Leptofilum sp.]|uniref:vWA domain-containing protein n=1 Tax=Candidatus Leptofilum sp. TaxID=3241576 RepID=UPI003B5C39D8
MTNNNGLGNLDNLFQSAQADGLTDNTMDLVISNLNGPTMATAVGTPLHQLTSNEVTLAMNIIDMSGSMGPHASDLITAYNKDYLAAMLGSSAADDILMSTIVFNQAVTLLHGYIPLKDVPSLNRSSYDPSGSTALYDAVAGGFTNMVLYAQQLRQSGVMVRCIVIVYSDGGDNASKQRAKQIRRAATELLKHEIYTLAYVGFRNGGINPAELRQLADEIGFPDVLATGLSHQELCRIFNLVSQSTISMSQQGAMSAGMFS